MITLTPESTPLRWLIVPTTLIAGALILSGCDSEPQRAIANDYQVFTQPAAEDDAPASEEVENIVSELEIEDEDLRGVGTTMERSFTQQYPILRRQVPMQMGRANTYASSSPIMTLTLPTPPALVPQSTTINRRWHSKRETPTQL